MKYMWKNLWKTKNIVLAAVLCLVIALAGCSSAPQPPAVEMTTVAPQNIITPAPTALVAPAQETMPMDLVQANPMDGMPEGDLTGEIPADEFGGLTDEFGNPVADAMPTPVPAMPGEINVGLVLDNEAVLHPLKCAHRDLISINELVFESVIALDDNLQPVGELAERWSGVGDEYTFTLRSNVQFHSGEMLTAQDVVESFQYIKTYGKDSAWYDRVRIIKEMTALDEHTLSVTFANGGFASLYAMTFPVVQRFTLDYAMPKGTGPYWYTGYAVNQFVRVESNPLWWKKTATVQSVVGWRYESTEDALEALYRGDIDTLATRSAHAAMYKKLGDYTATDYATFIYEMLVPNLTSGAMTDVRMREALMYAIDRTAIGNIVYGNTVQESEVPVVPGTYLYETQAAQYNYSPERALVLLHEIGWQDSNNDTMLDEEIDGLLENFTIKLVTYNDNLSEARTNAAYLIRDQLKKVGVTVEIETVSKTRMERVFKNGDFDIALIGVNLPFVPDLTELLRHDGDLNFAGYANKDMNNLLLSARSASTADELASIYSEIQRKIVEDLPLLGMYFHTGAVISTRDLSGLHGAYELNTLNGMELVKP